MREEPNFEILYRQGGKLHTIFNPVPRAHGKPPAVVLINPKYPHNVGAALRACACYGIPQLWYTGNRVRLDSGGDFRKVGGASAQWKGLNTAGDHHSGKKWRLPREERLKNYGDVTLFQNCRPFDQFASVVPVAVEVKPGSEPLPAFEHPDNAVYVFGPEDASIGKDVLPLCHRFVIIPTATRTPLNLAAAVYTVLYDRMMKKAS